MQPTSRSGKKTAVNDGKLDCCVSFLLGRGGVSFNSASETASMIDYINYPKLS